MLLLEGLTSILYISIFARRVEELMEGLLNIQLSMAESRISTVAAEGHLSLVGWQVLRSQLRWTKKSVLYVF